MAFEVAPQQLLRWFGLAAPVLILSEMWGWSLVLVTSWALVLISMMEILATPSESTLTY